ncbi:MAG TPA: hypothetical protein DEF45_08195 [Rhodopirellula sp.]|nr:hypothetical protein [Rhodopirellula sp.]
MVKTALSFGILLIANGAYGYLQSEQPSVTALIPAVVGTLILLCGLVSAQKPGLAKHFMHISALLGLLGTLAAGGRLASTLTAEAPNRFVQLNLAIMAILCGGYVFACFKSFRAAGRARRATESEAHQNSES